MINIHNRIIINGRAGVGKDVFADYLVQKYGYTKIAFANGIYDVARKYFGMTNKERRLLQLIGQKFREIRPLVWVDYTMKQVKKFDKVVISDCRQSNEYSIALENGFLPIRINAHLNFRIERLEKRDGHYPDLTLLENESETGADDCKFLEVDNDGSFEDLYTQIDWIMEQNWNEYIYRLQMEEWFRHYA